MLFMVIESFKNGETATVRERFDKHGRMLPENVAYVTSWIDARTARCFQVMEAPSLELLKVWTDHWDDLVEFEIIPVVTPAEFWARISQGKS